MLRFRAPTWMAAVVVSGLGTSVVLACVLLSPIRTWNTCPTLIVDNRGLPSIADLDFGVTATVTALNGPAGWNGTAAGTIFNAQAGSVAGFVLGDGIPMINFRDPLNVCTGSCLAATFTGFFSQRPNGTFQIDDADMVTNPVSINWTSELEDPGGAGCNREVYVESIVMHEVGHGLGFGHTNVAGATMFPAVGNCDNSQASIEPDDVTCLLTLYPVDSCNGRCGKQAPAGCWCDTVCVFFNDCCADKVGVCGP